MPSRNGKFQLGESVPLFTLPFDEESRYSLQEHLGSGPLLLAFIRGSWCPFCRRFLQQLLEVYERLQQKGCEVVVIASQPLRPIVQFCRREKLPFTIVSDADRRVTRQYGVYRAIGLTGINVARPSAFLLDEQGRILYQYLGSATDRPPLPEILSHLENYTARS